MADASDLKSEAGKAQGAEGAGGCEGGDSDLTAYLTLLASESPDLAAVVEAWDRLPEAVKVGILAMVKAAAGSK